MRYKLFDIADVIRSKNSGPFEITFDIIFSDYEMFKKVSEKKVINKKVFSEIYKIDESSILNIISFEPARAIKITIKRPISSGALGETDVYGAQQHVPLMELEFNL